MARTVPIVLALALSAFAGCSASVGSDSVSGNDLAKQVSSQLAKKVGQVPDKVTCPSLKAKVGAKARCTLTDGAREYGVSVTVTKVNGSDVNFDIQVDNTPKS
ncbi:DUF4333 domain-containing protein [Nocardioides terrisoli]|uniref:DUF4333 domain-containing protein n=1 Tax=Nocardioides terrisoli TaxID=3388267 RepID=UPI00287BA44A|nr:DUF4333 domain-containing protein [Nocardioides marmorisolisilvae]